MVSEFDTDDAAGLDVHAARRHRPRMPGSPAVGRVRRAGLERAASGVPRLACRSADIATCWSRLDVPDTDPAGARRADQAWRRLPGPGAGTRDLARTRSRLPAGRSPSSMREAPRRRVDCRGAETDMRRAFTEQTPARDVIREALDDLGVQGDDIEPFLFATALALPGWTGMFARLERHPEEHPGRSAGVPGGVPGRATAARARAPYRARAAAQASTPDGLSCERWRRRCQRAPPVLDAVAAVGPRHEGRRGRPIALRRSMTPPWQRLWTECAAFQRCSTGANSSRMPTSAPTGARFSTPWRRGGPCRSRRPRERPRAQFVFCIDEREESIRRAHRGAAPGLHHLWGRGILRRGHRLSGPLRPRAGGALPGGRDSGARGARTAGLHRAGLARASSSLT